MNASPSADIIDGIAPFVILCQYDAYIDDALKEKSIKYQRVDDCFYGLKGYNIKCYGVDVSVISVGCFRDVASVAKQLFAEYDAKLVVWIGFAYATTRKYDLNTVVISQNACDDDNYHLYTIDQPSGTFSPCAPYWLIEKALTAVKISGHCNRLNYKVGTVLSVPSTKSAPTQIEKWNEIGVRAVDNATAALYAAANRYHGDAIALNLAINYTSNVYAAGEASPEDAKRTTPRQEAFEMLMDIALNTIFEWGRQ